MRAFVFSLFVAIGLFVLTPTVAANGRFPAARYLVVGPGDRTNILALQTTFGIALSTDGGRTWRALCEDAIGFNGTYDPSLVITREGSVMASLPNGLSILRPDYCNFARPPSSPTVTVIDLAIEPVSGRIVAALAPLDAPNGVALSDDHGTTWRTTWTREDFYIDTVEIAPGHPSVLYASGWTRNGQPVLYRSDDGGQTFIETTRDFQGGRNAFVTAVDPREPSVVYVRSDTATTGTMLLRSDNGGVTFHELVRTRGRMMGFALSPDGQTLWVSGAAGDDGILRSIDGGRTWQKISDGLTALCLRYHSGILFACADEVTAGFALACSRDDGEHFTPILAFEDLRGPEVCPTGSQVRERCEPTWPMLRNTLTFDASVSRPPRDIDHGTDAATHRTDRTESSLDATRGSEGSPREPTSSCACHANRPVAGTGTGMLTLLISTTAVLRRHQRARRTIRKRTV